MKKKLYLLLSACLLVMSGCLKSLDKEGISETTRCKGLILEEGSLRPVAYVRLTVTNGELNGESTVTSATGTFSIDVTAQQIGKGYYLLMEADSLYEDLIIPLDKVPLGQSEYDMDVIYVQGAVLPTVTTDNINSITQTSAFCGGSVTNDGRSSVTARGICWSTSPSPTIINQHSLDGSGTGSFVSAINGLEPGKVYHVRAYAVNSVGISYGEDKQFTTLNGAPAVVTSSVSGITQNTAICGGAVTNDFGNNVTARGVCWSTVNTEPTIYDSHTSDGYGSGSYVSHLTNLQSGTHYYVRAYATNALGTGYGEVKEFTTF
ncbi:MAG: hypothetical protein II856_05375 [Bacteroidales bacterium]|nr:hypothetical protein [Bacteroidales bacterium]